MAIQQINQSFQNDGNFSLLELKDVNFGGNAMRMESYRASHPSTGKSYRTASKTNAAHLIGADHLNIGSNQIFRHIFSIENPKTKEFIATLEIRERFGEDGDWEVKMRDIDHRSASYGSVITCTVMPCMGIQEGNYQLSYEFYDPQFDYGMVITSPLPDLLTSVDKRLVDIAQSNGKLGLLRFSRTLYLHAKTLQKRTEALLEPAIAVLQDDLYICFTQNVVSFLKFGNSWNNCTHSGQNLIGDYAHIAADYIKVHQGVASMILLGKIFDTKMAKNEYLKTIPSLWSEKAPLSHDTLPGVYTTCILAHIANIEIYQLVLDKVHSDYGGISMKARPGSMLETGKRPVKSAYRANRTLAELAVEFYEPYFATRLK